MDLSFLQGDDPFRAQLRELEKRYEAFQQETRGRALKEQQAVHRGQYGDQFAFFRDGSTLASVVTEEVGVVLGKLKALSIAVKLPILGELVENLYTAIEKQFVLYYNEMQEKLQEASRGGGAESDSSLADERPLSIVHRARGSSTLSTLYDKQRGAAPPLIELHHTSASRPSRSQPRSKERSSSKFCDEQHQPSSSSGNGSPLARPNLPLHSVKGLVQQGIAPTTSLGTSGGLALSQRLTLPETLSTTTALLTESLAVSLRCELVRVYLLDDKKNLVRASEYPFPDIVGGSTKPLDLFDGNYTERGLAKVLFSVVCEKGLAVSGFDARQSATSDPNPGLNIDDLAASFQAPSSKNQLIRNCLVWPIAMPSGNSRVVGMIHAINKEGVHDDERRRFTAEDEFSMNEAAKFIGIMVERYPAHLFQVDVGSLVFKACHPDKVLQPHLPDVIRDPVEGAQRIGNEVLRTQPHIIIYRGPMATIYKQGSRDKKAEDYVPGAGGALSTITTVEYNLDALNDLWKSGYDENVMMHRQCRLWSTKVQDLQSIIKQFVDALVVARGIKDMNELLMYLRSMELLVRSENAPLLVDHINNAMENIRKTLEGKRRGTTTHQQQRGSPAGAISNDAMSPAESPAASPTASRGGSASPTFPTLAAMESLTATRAEMAEVTKRRERTATNLNIATMHIDGPTNVRGYTCDTDTKRNQVKAIDDMIERHREQTQRKHLVSTGPTFLQSTETFAKKSSPRAPPVEGEGPSSRQGHFSSVSRRMIFSAPRQQSTALRLHAPAPPQTTSNSAAKTSPAK
ncbi:Hypothetical protein, putative [Bodo saltans]|uniref:GAF domain-containing protein n=1 Tax=Bodo saltans TaxID=75058 RepID=A0A0S4KLZ0_BODSA|nr:Hypothetical protein, putative [Bodo saltans]|eukprot:CUI15601.1 Hypothetical protein, putative [Bodo saltans]